MLQCGVEIEEWRVRVLAIEVLGHAHLEVARRDRNVPLVLPDLEVTGELLRPALVLRVDFVHVLVVVFGVALHPAASRVGDHVTANGGDVTRNNLNDTVGEVADNRRLADRNRG